MIRTDANVGIIIIISIGGAHLNFCEKNSETVSLLSIACNNIRALTKDSRVAWFYQEIRKDPAYGSCGRIRTPITVTKNSDNSKLCIHSNIYLSLK